MSRSLLVRDQQARALTATLRAVRAYRGLEVAEVAQRMGLTRRTYERFEAGDGRLDIIRILSFAEATDSDGFAILAAVLFNRPAFGVECADNKLHIVSIQALERLSQLHGDKTRRLRTSEVIEAIISAFESLIHLQDERDCSAQAWRTCSVGEPIP